MTVTRDGVPLLCGIRALDDIVHQRPKAALWLVPLRVAALLAWTTSAQVLPAKR